MSTKPQNRKKHSVQRLMVSMAVETSVDHTRNASCAMRKSRASLPNSEMRRLQRQPQVAMEIFTPTTIATSSSIGQRIVCRSCTPLHSPGVGGGPASVRGGPMTETPHQIAVRAAGGYVFITTERDPSDGGTRFVVLAPIGGNRTVPINVFCDCFVEIMTGLLICCPDTAHDAEIERLCNVLRNNLTSAFRHSPVVGHA